MPQIRVCRPAFPDWRNELNYKSLTTLEYDKIIDRLVSFAASDKAKERLKKAGADDGHPRY